jgi:hypothetical protein
VLRQIHHLAEHIQLTTDKKLVRKLHQMKAVFVSVAKLKLVPQDDLQVYRAGDLVWTTVSHNIEAIAGSSNYNKFEDRQLYFI